jgi:beta-glucosidase
MWRLQDPFLAGELATAWIRGVQGDDPKYVKIAASIKHFSVYSMEASGGANRKGFDPNVTARDVAESYLPMFKAGIVDGGALGMMCSCMGPTPPN